MHFAAVAATYDRWANWRDCAPYDADRRISHITSSREDAVTYGTQNVERITRQYHESGYPEGLSQVTVLEIYTVPELRSSSPMVFATADIDDMVLRFHPSRLAQELAMKVIRDSAVYGEYHPETEQEMTFQEILHATCPLLSEAPASE